ncbi:MULTISPECIES: hypothetical protein [unclassified Pseudanabaena]|uniref:hypothetical protein n=1 Tax=unclassified Pseudanabaena TaxID=2593292 RepID=UPI0006D79ECC|nr:MULTISPECIES: hypothetical protein [unclassified Pseudanabaena]TYQ30287.1 hypothetical protein PseudUWO310_09715 [Pseudanabaena sp. UWO310]
MSQEDFQKQLENLEQTKNEKEFKQVYNLSQKNITIAVIISLLLPAGGYGYTRRWQPFLILIGVAMLLGIVMVSLDNSKDQKKRLFNAAALMGTIIAPIDNGLAIARAKKKIEDLKSQP